MFKTPSRRRRPASARRKLSALALTALLVLPSLFLEFPAVVPSVQAVSPDVVISQVYGGGGNSGATYTHDFVELFNRGASAVSLAGKSVQYTSATGTGNFAIGATLAGTLQPGQYYLVQMASNANVGSPLPTPDATGNSSMAAGAGKVAVVNSTSNLPCNGGSDPCTAGELALIIDLVGYGTANFYEGAGPAPTISATLADFRAAAGCTDTDNNNADFSTATPAPRNTSTALNPCGGPPPTPTPALSINDVSQSEGSGGGQTNFTFTVTLSPANTTQTVTVNYATANGTTSPATGGASCTAGVDYITTNGTLTFAANDTSEQLTVQVCADNDSEPNETFFVNLSGASNATISDSQGLGTIVNDEITLLFISEVQGSTPSGNANSPRVGQTVSVRGIVTLLKSNGFFLQEEAGDNDTDPNTSEGIFVFTTSAPTVSVGDQATVTGTVVEFNGLTEISTSSANVSVNSTGNTLPTAVTITTADLPPTANYAQPQLEKYEGMRLFAASLTTTAPNDNFFDVYTVITGQPRPLREPGIEANKPVPPDPTSGTPDPNVPRFDLNPERLVLDTNGRAGSTGETLTSNVVITNVAGPLDYAFGAYRLINEANLTRSANMSAVPVPAPNAGEFTVAGYNIENFNNNATQRAKAAQTICNVLRQPDIIGVVEIFDLADLQALATEVQTLCGVTYSSHLIEANGTSEDSDQDVGYLVKTSRVAVDSVTQEREEETFIPPGSSTPAILHDRPPLVLRARVEPSGANLPVIAVVNHTRSFICIDADVDPAVAAGCTNGAADGPRVREKRKKQAESLAGLFQELQTNNPTSNVIAVGDYNAFQFNNGYDDPISVMKGQPTPDDQIVVDQSPDLVNPNFYNLIDDLPAAEQYTFNFESTMQALDHHLVNTVAKARNTRTAIAHVNADFPEVTASVFASNAARPERNSDHDAVVSYYSLGAPQPVGSIIISEFRFRGPAVAATPDTGESDDEFVEVYNNTNSAVTVSTTDGSAGWAIVGSDGTTLVTIPNGTVIPARGHWLGVNAVEYSLANYGGTGAAEGDDGWIGSSIPDNGGVALFRTADPANYTLPERLDAVGYTTAPALYREGTGLPTGGPEFNANVSNFSFYRDINTPGNAPKDTGNNASDFIGVSVDGQGTGLGQRLGAPGPENLSSPRYRNMTTQMTANFVDPCSSSTVAPNRARVSGSYTDTLSGTGTYPLGYLDMRRKFTNNTGAPVTRLRFRVYDLTTFPSPAGTADLRSISAPGLNVTISPACGGATIPVGATTLEQPPAQPMGGGLNSTVSAGTVSLGSPLATGASIDLNFRFAVAQSGSFRAFIIVEALP